MTTPLTPPADFTEITQLIASARARAMQAVNTALIDLYWQVGQTISQKIAQAQWGDGVGVMRQFYEAYQGDAIVSPLARQLPWTHNLIILNQSKRAEEREFYLRQAIREQWTKRELVRQFKTALFERTVLHPIKVSPLVSQTHPEALSIFKDSYLLEFLGLPQGHAATCPPRSLRSTKRSCRTLRCCKPSCMSCICKTHQKLRRQRTRLDKNDSCSRKLHAAYRLIWL